MFYKSCILIVCVTFVCIILSPSPASCGDVIILGQQGQGHGHGHGGTPTIIKTSGHRRHGGDVIIIGGQKKK